MDELWQRYRTFWTPILIGIGALLVGLIVVYVINDDPEETELRLDGEARRIQRMVQPSPSQIRTARDDATTRDERVQALAKRLDQTGLAQDPIDAAVVQALTASILRGGGGADAFDGDAAAASAAKARFDRTRRKLVDDLRAGDPNVGFARIRDEVWSDLRLRANRADVDLDTGAEQLGFNQVTSVNRATLLRRLLNLALVARVVDLGIRSGLHSVDEIRFEERANAGPDSFLLEWPVTFTATGTMNSLRPLLAALCDPAQATPLLATKLEPPRRAVPGKEGLVELTCTAVSLRVQPEANLDLAAEEESR